MSIGARPPLSREELARGMREALTKDLKEFFDGLDPATRHKLTTFNRSQQRAFWRRITERGLSAAVAAAEVAAQR